MIDATIIPVAKQRNSREESEEIKKGKTPKEWKEQPDKLSQKDIQMHDGQERMAKITMDTKII